MINLIQNDLTVMSFSSGKVALFSAIPRRKVIENLQCVAGYNIITFPIVGALYYL